jgi:DNA modification methylase
MDADFNTLLNASLHESDIVSAVFETSGNSLVTAGSDGIIRRIEF